MKPLAPFEVWLAAGSQHLYGEGPIQQVAEHTRTIAAALDRSTSIPVSIVPMPVVTTPEAVSQLCLDVNRASNCVGLIAWMHTFSPAKMWIAGLAALQKPLLHLHTQFNRDLPWAEIDMDFMNLNQSAHGDREFGFIQTRMRISRKTVVGHWEDPAVLDQIGAWSRAACGWREAHQLKIVRFGDNMRQVAVTEGDKVEAQMRLGVSVNSHGLSELVTAIRSISDSTIDGLLGDYERSYKLAPALAKSGESRGSLRDAASIEAGLRQFLDAGGYRAFTDTFEDLDSLPQLPGLAVQRLMADGYGFGAEGDWKTAALVRVMKVMAAGLRGGTSFMEDYTYDLGTQPSTVLGAHMLEVCPSLASQKPSCEIHPLSIGNKADPVRLVFTAAPGPAVVAGLIDVGDRFRLVVNEVDVVQPDRQLPKLPVARAVWQPKPDFKTAAQGWLIAGGPHHTSFSSALTVEPILDFAEMAQLEALVIDSNTTIRDFKKELRWNNAYYHLARGI